MESEISDIYSEAQPDIVEKWEAYMKRGEARLSKLREKAEAEIKSGSGETTAQKAYEDAVRNYTLKNEDYKAMVDVTTDKLAHTNEIALAYSNDQLPDIYAKNWAQVGNDLKDVDLSFTGDNGKTIKKIVNEGTVKQMIQSGDVTTPFMKSPKYLNIPKDKRWNTKQINSSVLQGILQGESMDKIAKRIFPIVDRNSSAAIRNARTLVTGAENAGRQDSYEKLSEEGLVLKKVWIAAPDDRTREAHIVMDGQEVDVDEAFVDGDGNELEYPGDPSGVPETVYNCRCSMKTHVIGFRRDDGSISEVDFKNEEESMHERQIREEQERRMPVEESSVVNGTDISDTWQRRPDKFDFEIDDIINAQGFDGKPRVVSAEEFNKYVKEANDGNGLILQRAYSAPDQETLDLYRDQLCDGKWYVDCSVGTAAYGQGMYTTGNFDGTVTKEMEDASNFYSNLFKNKSMRVDEFTLAKDAKIAEYNDIYAEFTRYGMDVQNKNGEIRTREIKNANKELADDILKNSGYANNDDAKKFFYGNLSLENVSWDEMGRVYSSLGKETNKFVEMQNEFYQRQTSYVDEYLKDKTIDEIKDIGSYAASKGYDAMKVTDRGIYNTTEVLVFNRTKVIVKE